MMLKRSISLALLVLAAFATAPGLRAEVSLPNIFGEHMVLQQSQKNKIWGKADPAEKITVTIANQSHQVVASDAGEWSVTLKPMKASSKPKELVVKGTNEVRIGDVLIGEVWICSGQSNMEMRVSNSNDADLVELSAKYPTIRMVNFPNIGSQEPIWSHPDANWMVCSPETVGSFSAVGFFFGEKLQQVLDTPIGLINNSWGGSACEAWVSRGVLEAAGDYEIRLKQFDDMAQEFDALSAKSELSDDDEKKKSGLARNVLGNQRPANLYNGILRSHLGYGIRGAIWYQGESNAGRAYAYRDLFPLMIQSWRDEWGQGDFPFYWVQLADYQAEKPQPDESDWAELREAQTMTMSKLPHTGEAVIIDIGEANDIHPRNKEDVGRRLARWALANEYGFDIAHRSPTYQSMEKQAEKIVLTFEHVTGGWRARTFDGSELRGFAIAGADKKFVWADAKAIGENRIEVSSSQVSDPVAVRYAWADNPVCNVYTQLGLPLTPFRTDDWPGGTVDAK